MKNPCEELRECIGKLRYAKNRSEEEVVELHDRALAAVEVIAAELEAHARHDKYMDAEVHALRLFGNKDCTAQADEYLAQPKG